MRISAAIFLCASLVHPANPARADGDRILEFGTAGVAVFTNPTQPDGLSLLSVATDAEEILVRSDGSLLILMKGTLDYAGLGEDRWDTLTRFHPDGNWDAGYGEMGSGTTIGPVVQFPEAIHPPADVALAHDGSVVMAGTPSWVYAVNPVAYRSISAVYRISPNGVRDSGFGADGQYRLEDHESRADSVALRPNGHILFAGQLGFGISQTYVRELRSNGVPEPGFGDDGIVILPAEELPTYAQSVNARLAVQDDGRIVLGLQEVDNPGDWYGRCLLYRLHRTGAIDRSFGGNGRVDLASLVEHANANLRHLRLLSGGRILVGLERGGYWYDYPGPLVMLNAQGTPVPAFGGGDGVQEYPAGSWDQLLAMEVDANGRILLADRDPDFPIKRLLPDGSLDESFGAGGYAAAPELADVQALAIAPSGTIIAAGRLDDDYAAAHEIPLGSLGVIQFEGSAGPDEPLDTLFEGGFEP